jgi:hypothetical protein
MKTRVLSGKNSQAKVAHPAEPHASQASKPAASAGTPGRLQTTPAQGFTQHQIRDQNSIRIKPMVERDGTGGTWEPQSVERAWVPGFGEISVLVGPGVAYAPGQLPIFNFLIDCRKIDVQGLRRVKNATLVIIPDQLQAGQVEPVEIPMAVTADSYITYNGPLDPGHQKESKSIGALVSVEDLRAFAGGSGSLAFYVTLEMQDGSVRWVNKNSEAYNNFEINVPALKKH